VKRRVLEETMNLHRKRRGMREGINLVEYRSLAGWRGGGHSNTADRREQVLPWYIALSVHV
jgi:hypothetical protein